MSDVVVITGASGGIGRATARRFAQDGAKIALLARGEAGLEAAAREVEERGGKALVLPTDVAYAEQVEAAAQAAESELGAIDVWINNAMATIYAEFLDVEPYEYRRATDVTYHGMVWGTRAALKQMAARNRGTIVQVGSALAFRGIPLQAPYCGAKHACKGFTESVLTEIEHHGWDIHLTMVHLAGFNTTQFTWGRTKLRKQTQPVPPIYQPEVAADAIHWAAYHRRRQVYVGFPTVLNLLGENLVPSFLDWYLAKTGYSSQMTKQPLHGGPSHDNLYEPVDAEEDHGSHGPFDDEAHTHSLQTTLTKPAARRHARCRSQRGGDGRRAAAEALASRPNFDYRSGEEWPLMPEATPLRILVLGGTQFVGRAVVEAALARGHEITLFNRGQTNPDLFPGVEKLRGDRSRDLSRLEGRRWDAAIDVAAYVSRVVELAVQQLESQVERYVFVSSVSVYADQSVPQFEESELEVLADPEDVTPTSYGARKAACEELVRSAFGERATIVRPGMIVGPHDATDRFSYWPKRIAEGGRVLAPGDPDDPAQFIDVRDLGDFIVHLTETGRGGVFNATGRAISLATFLAACRTVTGGNAELVWVPTDELLEAGLDPWMDVPLWIAAPGWEAANRVPIDRALRAGLEFRPLEDTIGVAWQDRTEAKLITALPREREAELLQKR